MAWMTLRKAFVKAPRLLLKGEFAYTLDHMPLRVSGASLAKRVNMLRSGWETLRERTRLKSLPPALQIEPSNFCNLRCPLCPTGADAPDRKKGQMSLDLFMRILDESKGSLVSALLYGWGEPFLNKELPRMISECTARGIVTATSTNGHCIGTLEEALAVVDAGLTGLVIALDGSTQEVYERYRRGGNVEAVKRCAALIEEAKRLRRSPHPYTNLRAVLTRENEHDLANIRRVAVDLGVNMFSYKSVGCFTVSPEYASFETPESELRRFTRNGRHVEVRCPYAFRQPTIYWDGTVVGCEFDFEPIKAWGRIGEQSFPEIWNSPNAVRMREGILGRAPRFDFCGDCPYRDEGQEKTVLASEELKPPIPD
jgi:MoaA/NifB/PqqE/SkfB family radical SAM enzyme